jgi:zinc transporter, ZIP family
MPGHWTALLYAALAGATIPIGGLIARVEHIRPDWLETEFRHSVIAFGGGILVAAVALVLVPEGVEFLPGLPALLAFGAGGLAFCWIDRRIARSGASAAQLLAMVMDYLPESVALGAMLATGSQTALLLAALIALQNLPEGFNAYRELRDGNVLSSRAILTAFIALVALGPAAAHAGYAWLGSLPAVLGSVMLFAAGGILYLTFQDVAPQARLERHWSPSLGAVGGFMLGLLGYVTLG